MPKCRHWGMPSASTIGDGAGRSRCGRRLPCGRRAVGADERRGFLPEGLRRGGGKAADASIAAVPLLPIELEAIVEAPPPPVAALLADARTCIDAWFARPAHRTGIGFVPSDYEAVWRALAAVRRQCPDLRQFCEWGSGFGVVAGLAAQLGFAAHGIEIDAALVATSRTWLAARGLRAAIAHGSFVPADDRGSERMADLETRTVLGAPDGYDELGCDLDDFEVVFAYPWPTEEELYCDLFRRRAEPGAVLVTYSRTEGVRAYRKVARGSRR